MVLFTLFLGFLVGALTIIAAEVVAVVLVLRRLNRRETKAAPPQSAGGVSDLHDSFLPASCSNKQGVVWVLEPEKVPKSWHMDKAPKEQKRKKEIFEVAPVRKFAKVKDQSLILRESDGSHREIQLKGCSIAAVSATSSSSRKWARKYPIKVESKTSILYNGSKTLYIYLETSWEKESWCKALRHASCNDKEKLNWYSKLHLEFQSYLTTLTMGYPSFMKPSVGFNAEPVDRSVKLDGSSKVRHFLKKLAKKATKSGVENKTSWTLTPGSEEGKINEKYHSFQDSAFGTGVVKPTSIWEAPNLSMEDKMGPSPSTLAHSGSRSHISVISDADSDERIGSDEGTLCWNLLTSRLFFDAKSNTKIKSFIQARIQRTLSNMRKPGYIGELSCTGIDLGNLPPCINAMRLLPSDMNEVWALEIDIVYSGGAVLDIETRLEVRELDFEESMVDGNLESSSSMEGMASDLLEGFEYFEKQLELSEGAEGATKRIDETDSKQDGMKNCKTTKTAASSASRWKSILNSVAKQVSQVPLSLAVRVTSLKGTLRLHIKPPPSDQLWFGFTSMPDIDFNLESSVGEHKINSGRIALFLINRFKAGIRETLVLPNCESVCIPWMLAEKDDWIPQEVAPFLWVKQEAAVVRERPSSQPGEVVTPITSASGETTSDFPVFGNVKGSKVESFDRRSSESSGSHASSSEPAIKSNLRSKSVQELTTPLLSNDEPQAACESRKEENPECQSPSRSLILTGEQIQVTEGDDVRPKKMGTRARMLGLGKKMGEKLEEKKRHIEEKGRIIVDKMRGP